MSLKRYRCTLAVTPDATGAAKSLQGRRKVFKASPPKATWPRSWKHPVHSSSWLFQNWNLIIAHMLGPTVFTPSKCCQVVASRGKHIC
eukprot:1162069-Pelagomonas_calceolata.AAC.4